MKTLRNLTAVVMIAVLSITLSGCYGSFSLTKKVHKWNGSLGNKFVKEAVFLGLNIIPVYGVAVFLDAFILNLVEFWTGSNPLGLNPGDNTIMYRGQELVVNVQEDHVIIKDTQGNVLNELRFNSEDNTWYSIRNGESVKLMTVGTETVEIYTTSGEVLVVPSTNI